jgi:hypothetical protein
MEPMYFNAIHDRVHNQAIEIKRLQAELERAKKAYHRRTAQLYAERELAAERLAVEKKKTALYRDTALTLKEQVLAARKENKILAWVIKLAMAPERYHWLRDIVING